jgi:hypothetical protein
MQVKTLKQAQDRRQYAINLIRCIVMPLNERSLFAEQDERGERYRDLAIRSLKGEDVK